MWRCMRAAVCWTIWEERNSRIFTDKERSLEAMLEVIHIRVIHWLKTLALFAEFSVDELQRKWKEIAELVPMRKASNVCWIPPPHDFVKLNFDGSSLGNPGPSGIGGVIRDEQGNLLAMYSGPVGVGDSLRAEILAALEGVQRIKDMHINKLIIEGDSEVVVNWLKKDSLRLWNYSNEKRKFKWLTKDMEIQYKWVKRSVNSLADGLARQGVNRHSIFWAVL